MRFDMIRDRRRKLIVLIAASCAMAGLGWFITDYEQLQALLAANPAAAPLMFVAIYAAVGCTMVPLWPLQGVAGFAFGPLWALLYCQAGNAIAAYVTTALSEWLIGRASMTKIDPLLARLRQVQRRLGSTGIPLVMATRLAHFTPFGPCNVAFGILKLRPRDVAIGTLLGNNGSVGFYAILGAAGNALRSDWPAMLKLSIALATLNVALLTPLAWRYWRSRPTAMVPVQA
jgi:uncharacterized membrane protein YdjX (TVP38/TMEM64 family)